MVDDAAPGTVPHRKGSEGAVDRGQRRRGYAFLVVAAIVVPLATVATVSDGARLRRLSVRAARSAIDAVAGGVLEERGLSLVEGHAQIIRAAAAEFDVPAALLGGIMFAESRGRGGQTSSRGALGLMQLRVPAARDAAKRAGLAVPAADEELTRDLLQDEALNVRLGAAHLRWLLDHRADWSDEAVLVSYNAGRARLFQWIETRGSYAGWVASEERKAAAGERTTGSLAYAREVLHAQATLRERGALRARTPSPP